MKIVVLAGGLSPEREVSLSSGSLIANALRDADHKVLLLDLYKGIEANDQDLEFLFQDKNDGSPYSYTISDKVPDIAAMNDIIKRREPQIGKNVLKLCQIADVVFIALHGASGENGQIQATFNMLGIRHTGTDYIGCLLAMDKDLTKQLLYQNGINTAKWISASSDNLTEASIISQIGLPCVIKPCSAGSSIGVSIIENGSQLKDGIIAAKDVESNILVEQKIIGREFSVGVLNNKALPVVEIIPTKGFYDYRNKYQEGLTEEICPANLSDSDTLEVQKLALKVHHLLRLGSYSRVDFILNKNGEFVCLEANTLPGMTPTSLVPKEAAAVDISYIALCNQIAHMAL
jgi:D-alanine-D-alanine ligase